MQRVSGPAERPIGVNLLIAADQFEIFHRDRVVGVLNRRVGAGGLPLNALRREPETPKMDLLVFRVQHNQSGGAERPLRLLRGRVEFDLLLIVVGRRIELVDVLSAEGHERRMRRRAAARIGRAQLRHPGGEIGRDHECAVVAILEAVAGDVSRDLQLRPVAGDGRVNFRNPGQRLVHHLADAIEARAVGVDRQVRLSAVGQCERAARLNVHVAGDFERSDLARGILVVGVQLRTGNLEAANRRGVECNVRACLHAV